MQDSVEHFPIEIVSLSNYDFVVWCKSGALFAYVITLAFTLFQPPPSAPEFPPFPIKACILGKSFSGKSSAAQRIAAGKCLRLVAN